MVCHWNWKKTTKYVSDTELTKYCTPNKSWNWQNGLSTSDPKDKTFNNKQTEKEDLLFRKNNIFPTYLLKRCSFRNSEPSKPKFRHKCTPTNSMKQHISYFYPNTNNSKDLTHLVTFEMVKNSKIWNGQLETGSFAWKSTHPMVYRLNSRRFTRC